ncbi:MAG: MFS transporter [Nanoarchaeota archaeon]
MKREKYPGVRLLRIGTAIRWFGWGLGEALIPLFLLKFTNSFFETGLLSSVYNIMFLLFLPIAGYLADNYRIKKIILSAMILYIFVGLGYFLAGLTSMVIFLILARALNGLSYSLDQTSRETYIIKHVKDSQESRVFGHFDLITNFWWVSAVLIGMFLVKYVEVHWLFLMIAPTSFLALLIFSNIKEKEKYKKIKFSIKNAYKETFEDIKNFTPGLKVLAVLAFGFGIISSAIFFFAPILSYTRGGSITQSIIIVLVYTLPYLLGDFTGKIADKYKEKLYLFGLIAIIFLVSILAYTREYYVILLAVFFTSLIFECFYLVNKGILARIADKTHLGEVDGSLNGFSTIGAILGPILFGIMIDKIGNIYAYSVISVITLILFCYAYINRKSLRKKA